MTIGILFTVFVSWSIASLAIAQFFFYLRKREVIALNIHMQSLFFSLFWLVMGIVWLFAGASDLLAWSGSAAYAYDAAMALQSLVGAVLLLALFFFAVRYWGRRWLTLAFIPLFAVVIAFWWSLAEYGLLSRPLSFFANQFILTAPSQALFAIVFIPILLFSIAMLAEGVLGWRIPVIERRFILFAASSLILVGIGGSFEQFGAVSNYLVPSARLLTLIAAMAAYIATTSIIEVRAEKQELVI